MYYVQKKNLNRNLLNWDRILNASIAKIVKKPSKSQTALKRYKKGNYV